MSVQQASEYPRLTPALGAVDRWIADDLVTRRSFKLGAQETAALVLASQRQERRQLTREMATELGLPPERAEALVAAMERASLIVTDEDIGSERHRWAREVFRRWQAKGWRMAAECQVAAHDFPGVDYSKGVTDDHERIHRYRDEETDDNRFKAPASDDLIHLPPLTEELALMRIGTDAARTHAIGRGITRDRRSRAGRGGDDPEPVRSVCRLSHPHEPLRWTRGLTPRRHPHAAR